MEQADASAIRVRRRDNGLIPWLLARYLLAGQHRGKQRLWSLLYRAVGRPAVNVQYVGETRLALEMHDLVQAEVLRSGGYEVEVWEALAAHAVGGEVFWDAGAHVGTMSIRAAFDPRVRVVHAFEPNVTTAKSLQRNLGMNRQLAIVHHDVALSDEVGERPFFAGHIANSGLASLLPREGAPTTVVNCTTIDTLVRSGEVPAPTLLKIDVEGLEQAVLKGATATLTGGGLKAIVIEAETTPDGRIESSALEHFLNRCGYTVSLIRRPDGLVTTRENFLATQSGAAGVAPSAATAVKASDHLATSENDLSGPPRE